MLCGSSPCPDNLNTDAAHHFACLACLQRRQLLLEVVHEGCTPAQRDAILSLVAELG